MSCYQAHFALQTRTQFLLQIQQILLNRSPWFFHLKVLKDVFIEDKKNRSKFDIRRCLPSFQSSQALALARLSSVSSSSSSDSFSGGGLFTFGLKKQYKTRKLYLWKGRFETKKYAQKYVYNSRSSGFLTYSRGQLFLLRSAPPSTAQGSLLANLGIQHQRL